MSVNVSTPNAQGVAPELPFLIDRGLAEPCKHCPEAKKLAAHLTARHCKVALRAERVYPEGDGPRIDEAFVSGELRVFCRLCHDTGIVPTKKGWLLLGFLKTFFEDVRQGEFDLANEIPF